MSKIFGKSRISRQADRATTQFLLQLMRDGPGNQVIVCKLRFYGEFSEKIEIKHVTIVLLFHCDLFTLFEGIEGER
jgi:hypothetical protein